MLISHPQSEAAVRSVGTQELLEATVANIQEAERQGVRIGRGTATTPSPVYPSVGPGLITPPAPPAPPAVTPATATAEFAAPQPYRPLSTPQLAGEETPDVRVDPSVRHGKKRARLESRSPSPSPAPRANRAHPGTLRRSTQAVRTRAPSTHRPYASAQSPGAPQPLPRRQLAQSTRDLIAEALRTPTAQGGTAFRRAPSLAGAGPSRLDYSTAPVAGPSRLDRMYVHCAWICESLD